MLQRSLAGLALVQQRVPPGASRPWLCLMWGKLLTAFQNRHPCSPSLLQKLCHVPPTPNFVLPGNLFYSNRLCVHVCVLLNIGLVLLPTAPNWKLICQICLSALFLSVMPCGNMWLKGRGMRKDDFLKRLCSACVKPVYLLCASFDFSFLLSK